jgi:hypothetical protein
MLIWDQTDRQTPHDLFYTLHKRAYRTSLKGEQRLRNKKQKNHLQIPGNKKTRTDDTWYDAKFPLGPAAIPLALQGY